MSRFIIISTVVAVLSFCSTCTALPGYALFNDSSKNTTTLPIVDLGYQLQQATLYNATGAFYNFSNIRYARPPTGELRFHAPQPPEVDRSQVQDGSQGRVCPQANTAWGPIARQFIPQYLATGRTNRTAADFGTGNDTNSGPIPSQDSRITEDCLHLDIAVPKAIFENPGSGSPVLVWIYGGGYTAGEKSGPGNPAGLLQRSQNSKNNGVIFVSLNYRLGAFGWLSGPTFQQSGTANAGLYDQRLALEWVQHHIAKFGGDPKRVTVFGESAGGGSLMHQITAFGGSKPVPFQQAIPQSPGWVPVVSTVQQESTFSAYLQLLNVSTIEEARALPFESLQLANIAQVGSSPYGQFTYGPVVDGFFAPELPGQLLAQGKYPKNLKIMVGHNANEGLLFTSPYTQNDTAYRAQISSLLPTLAAFPSVLDYIDETLYPSQNYPDQIARGSATAAEAIFSCNTFFLDKAYDNQTYAYLFAVPPALHGMDVPYSFYNGPMWAVTNDTIAVALQEYITHFAEFGEPSEAGVPYFPMYSDNATIQVLNASSITQAVDATANERCDWWQKALYY